MKWISLPRMYDGIQTWGAFAGYWQYVLSYSEEHQVWGASAKLMGHPKFPRPRVDFGFEFKTRGEAEIAVQNHIDSTCED